jgi:curved DNA-binding protein CbpA
MAREGGMSDRDPYQVLGLGRDATSAEVARAYRRLARAVHPDSRPGDPAAAGRFRALSDAYGLLSDPARRAAWDRQHPAQRAPSPWPSPALQPRPADGPMRGAALRAGPVHIQPFPQAEDGSHARSATGPAVARLYSWLLAGGREWPW